MKHILPPGVVFALAFLGWFAVAQAEVSPFRVRVEQPTKSENVKFSKKQTRALKIFVTSSSKESAELVAKYIFLGRDVNDSDVVKIDEGEKAVSLTALGSAIAETGEVTTTFEEAHMPGSGSKGGKKVEASGYKFTGYGVQLYQGDKLVAEYYDPPSSKELWSKARPAKLPTAPKKK